jgi:hypothetical protein
MKLLSTIFALIIFATTAIAAPFEADAKTKRIPAGTTFSLQLLSPIDTRTNVVGDYFTAVLLTEQVSGSSVVLPSGSVVRGSVSNLKEAQYFSRGATLYLDFDHVVTPSGRQLPLVMSICGITHLTADGGIYGSLGYGEAVQENWENAKDFTINAVDAGLATKEYLNGIQYVATPVYAVGGAFATAGYFVWESVADMFRKGKAVYLKQGQVIGVTLTEPIDVPVY